MSDVKPGDRVRVTYEGVVKTEAGRAYFTTSDGRCRAMHDAVSIVSIEAIEPADDPSKDPISTVRVHRDDDPNAITARRYIKTDACWVRVSGESNYAMWRVDSTLTGWPKQSLADMAKVFGHGDAQPKLRTFKDPFRDLWFELKDNEFTYGDSRQEAIERAAGGRAEDEGLAHLTLSGLREKYVDNGGVVDVTDEVAE